MPEPIRIPSSFRANPAIQNRPGASQASSPRFNKACDSCHISKVRCIPDPQSPIGTCKRCSKNGTPCLFSPVGPRRRPIRTKNDRIAELERRVKDMQIKLEKQVDKRSGALVQPASVNPELASSGEPSGPRPTSASVAGPGLDSESPTESVSIVPSTEPISTADLTARRKPATKDVVVEGFRQEHGKRPSPPRIASSASTSDSSKTGPAGPGKDLIDRGLITKCEADQLISEFRSALNGKYLGIRLPSATTNSQLRRSRPAFWLSILCAASAGSPELYHLAPTLFRELKAILDIRINSGGEPDLDALQALMSWAIFHNDPVFPLGEHMVEMYSVAAQMAVDMAEVSKLHALPPDAPILDDDISEDDIQLSRELLHWYWASFSIAFKRRKPRMISQTHIVDASLRILQKTSSQSDARLIQWIKLVQIATDAVLALQHGHTQQVDGLSDEARDGILESFEKNRRQWLVDCPFHLVNEPLMVEYHSLVMLISEVIYPAGVADFRQRSYGLPSLSSPGEAAVPDRNFFAPYKIRYTMKSITAAHACLDIATAPVKPDEINADSLPASDFFRRGGCFLHIRIFYALRLLLSVAHEAWRTKKYDMIPVNTLKIDPYISALRDRLETASEKGRYRVPTLWLNALQAKIEPWWRALRRLLEREGQHLKTTASEESPKPPSRAVSPPERAGCDSLDMQLPAANFYPNLLDPPFSPFFPACTSGLFGSDPVSAGLSNDMLSFNGLLDAGATETDLLTTMPGESCESEALLPATAQQHVSTEAHSHHADIPRQAADLYSGGGGGGGGGGQTTTMHELDPLTFNWGDLSEFLSNSDRSYQPYVHSDFPERMGSMEQTNDWGRSA